MTQTSIHPLPELSDALVIINEFGEMALDHLLVAHNQTLGIGSGGIMANLSIAAVF